MNELVKSKLRYYLGTGLKVTNHSRTQVWEMRINDFLNTQSGVWIPYFRPLSDLTNPVLPEGKIPIEALLDECNGDIEHDFLENLEEATKLETIYIMILSCPMSLAEILISWHFWLWDQSLFDTGEILDLTTLK